MAAEYVKSELGSPTPGAHRNQNSNRLLLFTLVVVATTSLLAIWKDDGGQPYIFTSIRGEEIEIYGGEGPYRFDTILKAVMFRAYDWVNPFVCVPLFLFALKKGEDSFRGLVLRLSLFSYLAYNYGIGVFGNAYNELFLLWVALFSLGVFGIAKYTFRLYPFENIPLELQGWKRHFIAAYLLLLGGFLGVAYLGEIVWAYLESTPPRSLQAYTTLDLAAFELALMVPLHIVATIAIWKGSGFAKVLAPALLYCANMTFISLTVYQLMYLVAYNSGGISDVIRMGSFALLSAFGCILIYRALGEQTYQPSEV